MRSYWGENDLQTSKSPARVQKYITWHGPEIGWYSLNCDGAAKGNPGPAGGGGIIRDHNGTFVSAFQANIGHCSAFRAEVKALQKGLEIAKNLQIAQLEAQLDNLSCIQALNKDSIVGGECVHELRSCHSMLNDASRKIKLIHVYREGNRAAHWLANQGVAHTNNLSILESVPIDLIKILEEDVRGVATPCLVLP